MASAASGWSVAALPAAAAALVVITRRWPRGLGLAAAIGALLLAILPAAAGLWVPLGIPFGVLLVVGIALVRGWENALALLSPAERGIARFTLRGFYGTAALFLTLVSLVGGVLSLLFCAVIAYLGWHALARVLDDVPYACWRCRRIMRRLSPAEEASYLEPPQALEQKLGSVDYAVWQCDTDGRTLIVPEDRPASGCEICPRCGYRTLVSERRTIVGERTPVSPSREEIVQHCRNCGFTRILERALRRWPTVALPRQ